MARPAFRKPWEHGAKAYPEADSFEALLTDGCYRKRSPFTAIMVHADTDACKGVPCASCGGDLTEAYEVRSSGEPDTYAMIDVDPATRSCVARHYYCAWGATMQDVMRIRLAA